MNSISILTITFGLKIIQEWGSLSSLVFSPSLLHLADNYSETLSKSQIKELIEVSKIGIHTNRHLNLVNSSLLATWKYPYTKCEKSNRLVLMSHGRQKMLDFVCANQSLNERLIAEGTGFRAAGNSYFKILEIPLNEESLRMMIFLPKGGYSLEESLKILDVSMIKSLIDDLDVLNIHYKIPRFEMTSIYETGSKFYKFHFKWKRNKGDKEIKRPTVLASFVRRNADRFPYYFNANRPFLYFVFDYDYFPVFMGVFTGINEFE